MAAAVPPRVTVGGLGEGITLVAVAAPSLRTVIVTLNVWPRNTVAGTEIPATTSAVVRKRSRRCRLRKPIGRRGQIS